MILYPTTDGSDDGTSARHPVAPGRFPLFAFAHGVTASGPAYERILRKVAAAGFVVAAPTFPLTSGPRGWHNLADVVNQPADMAFVIKQVLRESAATQGLLAGHLDPDAVAVGGHSLGAITSLLSYNTCCRIPNVKAVVATSGLLLPTRRGNFDDPPRDRPLLLLHGEQDTTVPYDAGSKKAFAELKGVPRALVSFPDATHVGVLISKSYVPSIVAFLNLELRHDPTQWKQLGGEISDNGDASIRVAGGLPPPR